MYFEHCYRCGLEDGEWEEISHTVLLAECTDEQINMMIFEKATVRNGQHKYRRKIPEQIVDWAIVHSQLQTA
jgi:hypothetical protein